MEKIYTILIVDDVEHNLFLISNYLQELNPAYNILGAPNGKNALLVLQHETPDLIISDWEMPVMSGIELLRELKSKESTQDIPVMMITGQRTRADDLKFAFDAGAIDFIRKPVNQIELWARVGDFAAF